MTDVYLEIGAKKVFACSLDWPGWCRSGRSAEAALAELDDYTKRYAVIAKKAKLEFSPGDLRVVERVKGGSSTDFGAPEKVAGSDGTPTDAEQAGRRAALVRAAWTVFDAVAAKTPEHLTKGPRGGGRDRDKMVAHVQESEASYARMIGVKHKAPALGDVAAINALRKDIIAVLAAPDDGHPVRPGGWPNRYAARRIAWHVLDHLWEMQDKTPK